MPSNRWLIGCALSVVIAGTALLNGCGGLADPSNQPGGTSAAVWSALNGLLAPGDAETDDSGSASNAEGSSDGQFFSVVAGEQVTRIQVEAGNDQHADAGETVWLDGAAVVTGAELELAYHWEQSSGAAVTLDDASVAQPSFVAPTLDADSVLQFTLVVSAGDSSGSDSVTVNLSGVPPITDGSGADPNDSDTPPVGDTDPNDGSTPPVGDTDPNDGSTPPVGDTDPNDVTTLPVYDPPVAYAIDWGFDAVDSTPAIQGAIDSGARTVVVSNVGADWVVEPIELVSNQTVVFESGVVVAAKPGSFHGVYDCLITGRAVSNVTLFGYGATLRMRKQDYLGPDYEHSEWRSCLWFTGAENLVIRGLRCENSGGDGIWLHYRYDSYGRTFPSRNVEIRDCVCDGNYRQGISVTSAEVLRITNCVLSNSSGNYPETGIDIETDLSEDTLSDIIVSGCLSQDNAGHGFVVQTRTLAATAPPVSVRFENCRAVGCGNFGLGAQASAGGPPGLIEFRNCTVEGNAAPGIWARWTAGPDTQLRFTGCVLRDIGGAAPLTGVPIALELPHLPELSQPGRLQFVDCTVYDTGNRHFLAMITPDANPGVYDIRGSISVYNSLDYAGRWVDPAEHPGLTVTFLAYP